jgi:hypothetical protein
MICSGRAGSGAARLAPGGGRWARGRLVGGRFGCRRSEGGGARGGVWVGWLGVASGSAHGHRALLTGAHRRARPRRPQPAGAAVPVGPRPQVAVLRHVGGHLGGRHHHHPHAAGHHRAEDGRPATDRPAHQVGRLGHREVRGPARAQHRQPADAQVLGVDRRQLPRLDQGCRRRGHPGRSGVSRSRGEDDQGKEAGAHQQLTPRIPRHPRGGPAAPRPHLRRFTPVVVRQQHSGLHGRIWDVFSPSERAGPLHEPRRCRSSEPARSRSHSR